MMKRKDTNTLFDYFQKKNKISPTNENNSSEGHSSITNNENVVNETTVENGSSGSEIQNPSDTSLYDISNYVNNKLNNNEKLDLIDKLWIPNDTYKFPSTTYNNQKRRFQKNWIKNYAWLTYSAIDDGAYCKFCVFFAKEEVGYRHSQQTGTLVKKPYKDWKHATTEFSYHNQCKYHIEAMSCMEYLKREHRGKQLPVNFQIDRENLKQIEANRKKLVPIIQTVIACGRNGWPLRGHRDSGIFDINEDGIKGEGNFRALLRLRIQAGDEILKNHLLTCNKNAIYISPDIQNQIINCCNKIIIKKLVSQINEAQCFTVLADETADISCIEQYSICVRYFNENTKKICEHFLQFVPLTSTTGKDLAATLLSSLEKFGIDLKYLRGQGYDGAPVNTGEHEGVQKYVSQKYPTAVFVHCVGHSLNLVLSHASKIREINNCLGIVEKIHSFFESPKRHSVLSNKIEEYAPESNRQKLKQMCPTRWVERHDSVIIMVELLEPVLYALEEISSWKDKSTSSLADLLHTGIQKSTFLISLFVIEKIFSFTLPLCKYMQSENIDLCAVIEHVAKVESIFGNIRLNSEDEFKIIYDKAEKLISNLFNNHITTPRIAGKQTYRSNIDSNSPEMFYRTTIFIPFLDHVIFQLKSRFLNHRKILESFQCLIPTGQFPTTENNESFKSLISFYKNDMNVPNDEVALSEYLLWFAKYCDSSNKPSNAMQSIIDCNKNLFPNIFNLLKIFVTLPVATVTPERSFSTLKRLKNYLRNTVAEDRLNGLASLNIHWEIKVQEEEVIEEMKTQPRRLAL